MVTKAGRTLLVATLELVDDTDGKIEVNVWDEAFAFVKGIPIGEGVTFIGCTATREKGDVAVKVSLWDSAHVIRGGDRAQSLTSLQTEGKNFRLLTAGFTPSTPLLADDAEAYPTCAAALSEAPSAYAQEKVFQVNRCILDAPIRRESMFAQDGQRLYTSCRLRDWTGGVEVEVVGDAMPALYGCKNADEVEVALTAATLTSRLERVNARGVLRSENNVVKIYIAKITPSPLVVTISGQAMRLTLGLSEIAGDAVLAAPAERVVDDPMLGLAVRSDDTGNISAHRILLLVQGTGTSTLEPMDEKCQSVTAQSFRVMSENVRCLLSNTETYIDLHGYCDFQGMLQYRLDKDVALVFMSAWSKSQVSDRQVATIEHMRKLGEGEKTSLLASLAVEWKAALTHTTKQADEYQSPQKADYWERPTKKLRSMESEAVSPHR
jgi:hypothetical protein